MKIIKVLAVLAIFTGLISCGGEKESSSDSKKAAPVSMVKKADDVKKEVKAEVKEETPSEPEVAVIPTPKEHLDKATEIIKSVKKADIKAVDAGAKFKMYCAACHGFKGNMMVNGAKDLTKSKASLQERVAQVYFGKGLMTPFKGVLSDAEIVAVSTHLETLR